MPFSIMAYLPAIALAPAAIAFTMLWYPVQRQMLPVRWWRISVSFGWGFCFQVERAHDHARRAEAALEPVVVAERFLHRVQRAVLGQALDGRDAAAFGLGGQYRARLDGAAVDVDDARAALAGVAADVGAGQAEMIAQIVNEQGPFLDRGGNGLAVHRHRDGDGHRNPPVGHALRRTVLLGARG